MCKKRTLHCFWYKETKKVSMLGELPLPEYRGEVYQGVPSRAGTQESLAALWRVEEFHQSAWYQGARAGRAAGVCPEVPWWTQCQAFIPKLMKFTTLLGVCADCRIQRSGWMESSFFTHLLNDLGDPHTDSCQSSSVKWVQSSFVSGHLFDSRSSL